MRRVLLVSYWFPPRPPEFAGRHAAGVAKHLPEFGWEPTVLTPILPTKHDTGYRIVETPYTDSLRLFKRVLRMRSEERLLMYVAELKERFGVDSERSLLDVILRLGGEIFAYPDPQKGWRTHASSVANAVLTTERVDAMVSISPPVTSHLIARDIRRIHGMPWVAYFLDLWTQNHYYPYGRLRRALERRLELGTLSGADVLATVSQPLAEKLGELHRDKRVEAITLGFDTQELEAPCIKTSDKFTITYTGNVYPGKQDPEPLFKALAQLISEGAVAREDVEVRFYGPELGWVRRQIARNHLEDVARQLGFVPRQVVLEKQRESQLLLLLGWTDPSELGVYTAKVFEYLASRRPILVVGGSRHGVLPALLEETRSGTHCPTVEDIKTFLEKAYREYKDGGQVSYHADRGAVANYSYREMARRFSVLLDQLAPTMSRDTER